MTPLQQSLLKSTPQREPSLFGLVQLKVSLGTWLLVFLSPLLIGGIFLFVEHSSPNATPTWVVSIGTLLVYLTVPIAGAWVKGDLLSPRRRIALGGIYLALTTGLMLFSAWVFATISTQRFMAERGF